MAMRQRARRILIVGAGVLAAALLLEPRSAAAAELGYVGPVAPHLDVPITVNDAGEPLAGLWTPVEWKIAHDGAPENPFDVQATATFTHVDSGETRTTGLFYDGAGVWRFRFTGTRTGWWTFRTAAGEGAPEALGGHEGRVGVLERTHPNARGFLVGKDGRWVWSGTGRAFVPQIVMYRDLEHFGDAPAKIDADLKTWFEDHKFNGLHTGVLCRWFDFDKTSHDQFDDDDPNPDPRTFEALELLITRAYRAGGLVFLWAWGDEQRRMTPVRWGINGPVDRRLQRYIAARLGPLPGWFMGYGFDNWEWVQEDQLLAWHAYMHAHFGWPHLLGARGHQNRLDLIAEGLDYASYEQHRPDYDMYVRSIAARPGIPVFSEDRFRVRDDSQWPEKDYDIDMTRRGLWHSTMAGGVANIWGFLNPTADEGASQPYPNAQQVRTYSTFFFDRNRFTADLIPDPSLTDYTPGVGLEGGLRTAMRSADNSRFIFYAENADEVTMDLTSAPTELRLTAVNTRGPYGENLGNFLAPGRHVQPMPSRGDWVIAVGDFPPWRGVPRTIGPPGPGLRPSDALGREAASE